jgi:hypothetical protein
MLIKNKRGISVVISILILLLISILSVIFFSKWYQNYQSKIFLYSEQRSSNINIVTIEDFKNNVVYLTKRNPDVNITIYDLGINGVSCGLTFPQNYSQTLIIFDLTLTPCNDSGYKLGDKLDIIVVLEDKIISKKIIYD